MPALQQYHNLAICWNTAAAPHMCCILRLRACGRLLAASYCTNEQHWDGSSHGGLGRVRSLLSRRWMHTHEVSRWQVHMWQSQCSVHLLRTTVKDRGCAAGKLVLHKLICSLLVEDVQLACCWSKPIIRPRAQCATCHKEATCRLSQVAVGDSAPTCMTDRHAHR